MSEVIYFNALVIGREWKLAFLIFKRCATFLYRIYGKAVIFFLFATKELIFIAIFC